jgi:DNA-binding response OmpR family regulator
MPVLNHCRILVAEDDPGLRSLIAEILMAEGYSVITAEDGEDALHILRQQPVDILITDIHMPRLDGFSLLQEVAKHHSHIQRIVLTAFDADEYMDLIQTQDVGNVLIKTVPFESSELCLLVQQLSTQDIFGLEKHLEEGTVIQSTRIRRSQEIEELSVMLSTIYGESNNSTKLRTVLVELLTNAVFYGARNEKGDDKSQWQKDFTLSDEDAIVVCHGQDHEKIGFAIVDRGGRLDKKTILYWLNRQITLGENGFPTGLFDSHGRGLFIVRRSVDRLQVHVDPGQKCECIILNYKKPVAGMFKPLRIIELNSK